MRKNAFRFGLALFAALMLALSAIQTPALAHDIDTPPSPEKDTTFIKVINHTTQPVRLWLHHLGLDRFYYMETKPGMRSHLDVPMGELDYAVSICGLYTTGNLDVQVYKVLDVPVCGARYKYANSSEDIHIFELENAQEVRPVRLTILNDNYELARIKLAGPMPYELEVQPYSESSYSIMRGEYTWSMFACGKDVATELDFTHPATIYIPKCGAKGWNVAQAPEDFKRVNGEYKEVAVTLENKSDRPTPIRLTGPSVQAFYLFPGDSLTVTIPRGDYTLEHWGCDPNAGTSVEFQAKAYARYTIKCKP